MSMLTIESPRPECIVAVGSASVTGPHNMRSGSDGDTDSTGKSPNKCRCLCLHL